jgi:predicted ArsR family transcriptional regulator
MAALQQKLKLAVAQAQRDALLGELLSNGDLTIGELAKVKGELGDTIRRLTINELRAGGASRSGTRSGASATKSTHGDGVDTRTGAGRRAYQEALLALLSQSDEPMAAPDLRRQLGGTPDQARRALNRLIETGAVTYTGKARGTRYRAKG